MKPQTEITPALAPLSGEVSPQRQVGASSANAPPPDAGGSPHRTGVQPRPTRQRLLAAIGSGLLFFAWIGYLLYLVQTRPQAPGGGPVVISRPQFLISELDVVAYIKNLSEPAVIVKKVLYPKSLQNTGLEEQPIIVTNLAVCGHFQGPNLVKEFTGAGEYILALRPTGLAQEVTAIGLSASPNAAVLLMVAQPPGEVTTAISYEVVPTPPSPGYPPFPQKAGPPRIYPAIKANLEQVEQSHKPE